MARFFTFSVDGKTKFRCRMRHVRCRACGARSDYPPYCRAHTDSILGVRVARSRIRGAGWGLFATRAFAAGNFIAPLFGDRVTSAELTRRYGAHTSPYGVMSDVGLYDGACLRYVGHMSNTIFRDGDDKSQSDGTNATINSDRRGRPWIAARAPIALGEEILTYYGPRYTLEAGTHHATQ